jgi:hypothetical protein
MNRIITNIIKSIKTGYFKKNIRVTGRTNKSGKSDLTKNDFVPLKVVDNKYLM